MTTIGKYEIVRELGKGASSTVYLALDTFANRQVAIKRLNPEGMTEDEAAQFRKLFQNEASLAGKIQHPYITSIYDAALSDDLSYLVMEYVGGGTLEHYCQVDNLLPHDKVIEIIFKCCRALNYACQNGIIHRDIKPENILVSEGTDIKISDFGAAIIGGSQGNDSQTGHAGSLAYMSPQQAQGMELTQQADIYSLGVMFYKMLTGSLPFTSTDDASLLFQILNIEPPAPSTYRLDLPQFLDNIVMRAIAKNLEDRYADWNEFESELLAAFDQLPKAVSSFPDTEKFNILRKLDFFKEFGEVELWEVLRLSKWAYYPEGTTIIREGDKTDSFFVIASGKAEVRKNGRAISSVNGGECLGEMAHIRKDTSTRSASVIALTDVKLIEIYEHALEQASQLCKYNFAKSFMLILANRLAEAREQQMQLLDKSKKKTVPTARLENKQAAEQSAQQMAPPSSVNVATKGKYILYALLGAAASGLFYFLFRK